MLNMDNKVDYLMFASQYHYKIAEKDVAIRYLEEAFVKAKEEKKNTKKIEYLLKMYKA